MDKPQTSTTWQRAWEILRWIGYWPDERVHRRMELAALHRLIDQYPHQARIFLRERDRIENLRIEDPHRRRTPGQGSTATPEPTLGKGPGGATR